MLISGEFEPFCLIPPLHFCRILEVLGAAYFSILSAIFFLYETFFSVFQSTESEMEEWIFLSDKLIIWAL